MTMTLVETITVGSGGAASIEFTGIPGDGKDLLLKISGRIDNTNSFNFTLNSNTGSIYSRVNLAGSGSSAFSQSFSNTTIGNGGYATKNEDTANTFASNEIYLSNYASSSNKSGSIDSVTENNGTTARQIIQAVSIDTTAAITSIQIIAAASQTLVEHSTASLYIIS